MSRFHSKLHNLNHHSEPTSGYPDSATDPIADQNNPFQGDFFLTGKLDAKTIVLSEKIDSLEIDSLIVNNTISTLSVGTLTVSQISNGSDGSGLINVNADQLDGFDSIDFQLISQKNTILGYAGLDSDGKLPQSIFPDNINLSSLNFVAMGDYLVENDLSSTVTPLISSNNSFGSEVPDDFLPNDITELSSINGISLSDYLINSDIGTTVQPYDSTILTDSDIGTTVQPYDSTILTDSDIGNSIKGEWVSAPSLSGDSGNPGDFAYDSDFLYICVATDSWKRVGLSGW